MNIAVISDGTFNEEFYKNYIEQGGNSLACVINKNAKLPKEEYDVILVDYYNENISIEKIHKIAEEHPKSLFTFLADIDIENDPTDKETEIIKKFTVQYAFCYNIKETEPKELSDFIQIMTDIKNECENAEAPFSTSVILWVMAFLALVALGIAHYFH